MSRAAGCTDLYAASSIRLTVQSTANALKIVSAKSMHRPRHAIALDTNRSTTGGAAAAGGAVTEGHARSREVCMRATRCLRLCRGPPAVGKWARSARLRTSFRRAIIGDTGLPQELAKQMREVTRQIAGLTNELERLLPRDRYIRDRPTNAPPAGCSDDSAR